MSKCTEIREICGDYAFDVEYSQDNKFTMLFNSLRNAQTVKRCIEVDDSVPNVATAVDFVEVVRCKDCKYWEHDKRSYNRGYHFGECTCPHWEGSSVWDRHDTTIDDYCSQGERKEQK